jgi:lactate permease
MVFYMFLPLVATLIGFCMLWIVGRLEAIKRGVLPCLLTGATIAAVAWFTNRSDNLVVLTGVLCGLAVMLVMALYLIAGGHPVLDSSRLTDEERDYARSYPLWRALLPWTLLIALILCLNLPQQSFNWLYRTMKLSICGLTADGRPLDTRLLWQAYTWILASTLLALPFLRLSTGKLREAVQVWLKRAPRPVFAAAIFFAIGEVMNMSGYDMAGRSFATPSMVRVLADHSALLFQDAYGLVVAFIGLFGGFITGSEASTIAMFAKYTLATAKKLELSREGLLIVTAGLAFGGGLASVISPAKLQNAAAAIDRIGEEGVVIRIAFLFALGLTLITALFVVLLLWLKGG